MKFTADPAIGGGGEFLKLKDKQFVVGVFRGDPLEFYVKWTGKKSAQCLSSDDGAKFRFRVNIIVNENGNYKSYIWEQGPTVYTLMKTLNADFPLESNAMKITRSGSSINDTEYHILPVPNGKIDDTKEVILRNVALQDLRAGLEPVHGDEPPQQFAPDMNAQDQLPF